MSTNPDVLFVRDHLSSNPDQLRTALAVHDAWVLVRDDVCKRFLEHLCEVVKDRAREALTDIASDCNVKCHYEGEKKYWNWLEISRDDWVRYNDEQGHLGECTQIRLESVGPPPNRWYWGVKSPKPIDKMSEAERERREDLSIALQRHGLMLADDKRWPQWEWLRKYQNWAPIVPELAEECETSGGPITDFYVNGLLDIARCAIPAINEIETVNRASSSE